MGGVLDQEGRIEVCMNGLWSSVCGDGWDQGDGLVACRQLGMSLAEPTTFVGSQYGDGNGPIVYSNFGCEGFEDTLSICSKTSYPSITCSRSNIAGVLCRDGEWSH